jgi:glycosyltransferase involved in cell wall biosynthesis
VNRGQGAALETGHAYAREINADFVLHFDGDEQFDSNDISPALAKLKKYNADILFGSRFLDSRSRVPWFKRHILLPSGRLFNRLFFGVRLSDAHNGFRILNKKALDVVIIRQDRMAHASEIPALAKKHNLRFLEYPVKVTYHEYGQGGVGSFRILKDLLLGTFIR